MWPVILALIIVSSLIIAYGSNATARVYIKLFLIFLFVIMTGFIGAIFDSNVGLDGNFSIVFSIGAATMFIARIDKDD